MINTQFRLLLITLCIWSHSLFGEIHKGMSREDVIAQYGNPVASMQAKGAEKAIFANNIKVTFINNVVATISGVDTVLNSQSGKSNRISSSNGSSRAPVAAPKSADDKPEKATGTLRSAIDTARATLPEKESGSTPKRVAAARKPIATDTSPFQNKTAIIVAVLLIGGAIGIPLITR